MQGDPRRLKTSKKKETRLLLPLSQELASSDEEDNTKSVNNHILTDESREEQPLRVKFNGQVPTMDLDSQSRIEKSRCLGNELNRLNFSSQAIEAVN